MIPMLWLLVLLTCSALVCRASAQPDLRQVEEALLHREQAMQKLETVWQWTREVPADPVVRSRLEELIQRALEREPPSDRAAREPGIRSFYQRLAYGYRQDATWIVRGFREGFSFEGELPVIGEEQLRQPYRAVLYPTGLVEAVSPFPGAVGLLAAPYSQWILNEPALMFAMTGASPTRWLTDMQAFSREGEQPMVTLRGRFRPQDAPRSVYTEPVEFVLDASKGYAISEARFPRQSGRTVLLRVKSWRKYGDLWLPEDMEATGGNGDERQKLTLLKVRPSNQVPPEWLKPGAPVTDLRQSEEGDSYRLPDYRLPTLEEASRLAQRERGRRVPLSTSLWWRFGPPILLITAGLLWYWRLKMKKVS